jgi:Holliday junction resolvase RusA-like endonuclease
VKGNLDARFTVVFRVPMPASWSEKRKLATDGSPHQRRPDLDNYIKSFMDSLCTDDSYIYDVHAQKFWARTGSIELTERGE